MTRHRSRNSLQCAHCGWSCPHDDRSLRDGGIPPRAMSKHMIANKDDPDHAAFRPNATRIRAVITEGIPR